MRKDRFHVLPYSIHQKHIESFMGRIVVDHLDPNRRYYPDIKEPSPQSIIPDIQEDPIPYRSRADVIRSARTTTLQAILASYFKLCGENSTHGSVAFQSEVVKRYQMTQNEPRFKELMANANFAKGVTALMNEYGKVYMIVGFLTTKATKWDTEAGESRLATARAKLPLNEITGMPNAPSVGLDTSYKQTDQRQMTGEVEEEEIFAVAYDFVKKKHTLGWNPSMYVSSRPVLGSEKRAKGGFISLGDDDSDQEVECEEQSDGETSDNAVFELGAEDSKDDGNCIELAEDI